MKRRMKGALILAAAIGCAPLGGAVHALPSKPDESQESSSTRSSKTIEIKDACANEDCAEKTAGCLAWEAGYVLYAYIRDSEGKGQGVSSRLRKQYSAIVSSLESFPQDMRRKC
jgi:hypothetical protein